MIPYGQKIINFLFSLNPKISLPENVNVMNPFLSKETQEICKKFYLKYYDNFDRRTFIIGINPGRFGAGVTGIPFTDPIRLETECQIVNSFQKKQELSSVYIYDVINRFGGPESFYSKFYFTSVSPLGFIANGKNMNYYDSKDLQNALRGFIINTIEEQLGFGANTHTAICLGEGKNYKYLKELNKKMHFFKEILALPHPRFIMQYRFKRKEEFIQVYLNNLNQAIETS